MPTTDRVPTDVVGSDLVNLYARGAARLQALMQDGLRRGLDPDRYRTVDQQTGDATLAYYERQMRLALAILADMRAQGANAAPRVTASAYSSSILAVDKVLEGTSSARGTFGGIHQGTVQVLAGNLARSLDKATAAVGTNVASVFARAALLEGALPPNGLAGVGFIGRREDDAWRRLALEAIGGGTVALQTRRQITAGLLKRLVDEGVTDALTGFVDRAGRRWSLPTYTEMVVRTTTREATSRATVTRLADHGLDVVKITSHPHRADICTPYDGKTFSLSGEDRRYPRLATLPPFHPRCRHVVAPATANLDDFERELERQAAAQAAGAPSAEDLDALVYGGPATAAPSAGGAPAARRGAGPASTDDRDDLVYGNRSQQSAGGTAEQIAAQQARRRVRVMAPGEWQEPVGRGELLPIGTPDPPLTAAARARRTESTVDRLEAQRIADLIGRDPGPEPGYLDAVFRDVDKQSRAANRALNKTLGPDLVKFIDRKKNQGMRASLHRGDITIEEVEQAAIEDWNERNDRKLEREYMASHMRNRGIPCFICGKFKRRPADVCQYCGDDPVPLGINEAEFNRGYGYDY